MDEIRSQRQRIWSIVLYLECIFLPSARGSYMEIPRNNTETKPGATSTASKAVRGTSGSHDTKV